MNEINWLSKIGTYGLIASYTIRDSFGYSLIVSMVKSLVRIERFGNFTGLDSVLIILGYQLFDLL
jgi:hypothetical protein